jgi:hypothetical protein
MGRVTYGLDEDAPFTAHPKVRRRRARAHPLAQQSGNSVPLAFST